MSIFLVDFASKAISVIHDGVFMIATVQHHTAGENDEAAKKDKQNLQALLATVHKITVENVAVCVRW